MTDWYRRTTWSEEDERDFQKRLERARAQYNKSQYLRIQACTLLETGNAELLRVAIKLTDQFLRDDPTCEDAGTAYWTRMRCHLKLRQYLGALEDFRACAQAQRQFPRFRNDFCYIQFATAAAAHQWRDLYNEVLQTLDEFRTSSWTFMPSMTFEDQAACANIHHDLGHSALAREHAERALQAAHRVRSNFQKHPNLGVVKAEDLESALYKRLEVIANSNS